MEDEFREQMRKMINTMEAVAHFIWYKFCFNDSHDESCTGHICYRVTQKNATHIIIDKSLTNCNIALIFQVLKEEDLLHERLKPYLCQNGLMNSRKNVLCRNLLWDQILLCSTKMLSPKVQMLPLSWQVCNSLVVP